MALQLGFTVDLAKCVGCKSCAVSCAMENNTPVGTSYRDVIRQEAGSYPAPSLVNITTACNHCKDPSCVKACPVAAIAKRSDRLGIVLIDQDACIGCRRCTFACPYGAPRFNPDRKKTEKCTFCIHRVLDSNGQLTGLKPACVSTCPAEALDFEVNDVSGTAAWPPGASTPVNFVDRRLTNPNVSFKKAF